jgi:hypothetical protein
MSSNIENIYFECNPTSGEGSDVIEIKPKTIQFDKTSSKRTNDFSYWLLGFAIFSVCGYMTSTLFGGNIDEGKDNSNIDEGKVNNNQENVNNNQENED